MNRGHRVGSSTSSTWRCTACTFVNALSYQHCCSCNMPSTKKLTSKSEAKLALTQDVSLTKKSSKTPLTRSSTSMGTRGSPSSFSIPPTRKRTNHIHTTLHSRLNHTTAAYRGKFQQAEPDGRSNQIYTLNDCTLNGLQSTISRGTTLSHKPKPILSSSIHSGLNRAGARRGSPGDAAQTTTTKSRRTYVPGGGVALGRK